MTGPGEHQRGEIVIYQAEDGAAALEVRLEGETVWLDAHQMAQVFQRDRSVILRHIRNIYATSELPREATCAKYATVQTEGSRELMFRDLVSCGTEGFRVGGTPKQGTTGGD